MTTTLETEPRELRPASFYSVGAQPTLVPFVDLGAQHRAIRPELDDAVARVVSAGDFILGADVEGFEREFADYCGVKHAVGVDTGLSALEIALRCHGIGAGDEVITVSHTFIATASAISATGATPVLVDIDPLTLTMDVQAFKAAITTRTRAVIPVHLYGQTAEMRPIRELAMWHGLIVVEDACQAHGALYDGQRAGSLGHAAAFSFYPGKNLGGFGDGGILVTDDAKIAEHARMLRNYGQREKYHHVTLACNRRLDTLQAAVLRVKLRHLDDWNAQREQAATRYDQLLRGCPGITLPQTGLDRAHVHHLYVIRSPQRDALLARLKEAGVSAGLHYPVPVHQQPCYRDLSLKVGSLPLTESVAAEVLSLPIFPGITEHQIGWVAHVVRDVMEHTA